MQCVSRIDINVGRLLFLSHCETVGGNSENRLLNPYCNKRVLSLTHTLILNLCLTMSMHGLYKSTQHLDETLEPLIWIRVRPSCHDNQSRKRSHVLYYVSCKISKYTTFKPHLSLILDIHT